MLSFTNKESKQVKTIIETKDEEEEEEEEERRIKCMNKNFNNDQKQTGIM